jgi:protein phosphatase
MKGRPFLIAMEWAAMSPARPPASSLSVHADFVIRSRSRGGIAGCPQKDLTPEQSRPAAVTLANRRITTSSDSSFMKRMGTTLVGALIEGEHLAIVNVGDSRAYRIRAGQIEQITADHSFVGEQQKSCLISREEARAHPQRNILTSALGLGENPQVDLYWSHVAPGDLYLLCSDGLHAALSDEEILEIILSIPDRALFKIGLSLVLKANLAGGRDDTTIILIAFS